VYKNIHISISISSDKPKAIYINKKEKGLFDGRGMGGDIYY
jgi:hypothetical protein